MTLLSDFPVILLAAGNSSRMGTPKGLLDFHGRPWLCEQIMRLEHIGLHDILIVLGFHLTQYLAVIPQEKRSSVYVNPNPQRGPFSSLVTGLQARQNAPGIFILPVDVPCPDRQVWVDLHRNFFDQEIMQPVLSSAEGLRAGHPVLLSRSFHNDLLTVPMDSTEARLDRQIRKTKEDKIGLILTQDPQIRLNLNTPEEWIQYQKKYHSLMQRVKL